MHYCQWIPAASCNRSASLSQSPSLTAALIQPYDLSCSIAYVSQYKPDWADTDPLHEDQRYSRRWVSRRQDLYDAPVPPDFQYRMRLHAETVFAYTQPLTSAVKMHAWWVATAHDHPAVRSVRRQGHTLENVPEPWRFVTGVRYRELFSFRNYIGAVEIGEDRDKVRIFRPELTAISFT